MPKLIANDGTQLLVQGNEASVGRVDGHGDPVDLDLGSLERGRTVSRRHARLIRDSATWKLRVETPMNETKVAGRALKAGEEAALRDGDEILLGAVTLTFKADADLEATMVGRAQAPAELRTDGLVFPLSASEGRRLWIGRPQAGGPPAADMIDLSTANGARSVSHQHAQVYRTPGGWMLHEGRTTNATIVNGRQLQPGEDVLLTDGVAIQLGRVLVTFHEVRPVRVVTSDVLTLEVEPEELTVNPGLVEGTMAVRLVNATGRVEQVVVEVEGLPTEWYHITQPDGTSAPTWRLQLVPTGPDLLNPVPNSFASGRLVVAPARTPQSRAGLYSVSISATTQGEDRVRRVVPTRVNVLPFEDFQMTLSPTEAKGASARFNADVVNAGNANADVSFKFESDPNLICVADPDRLTLANGTNQRAAVKVKVKHHHWWGPPKTHGIQMTAMSGTQNQTGFASLTTAPIIPEWLQGLLNTAYNMLSPIAIPVATLAVLMSLAYVFLRPPDISSFTASPATITPGQSVQLIWTGDRIHTVSFEPNIDDKQVSDGAASITPDKTTLYTLTAKNWVGLPSTKQTSVTVLRVLSFTADPPQLATEKQEVTLKWQTDGADSVKIDPADEIKDPKLSDEQKVHPSATTIYTLTATAGNVSIQQAQTVTLGKPTIKSFQITDPPPGTKVFPGGQVKLAWQVDGVTKAIITADKGDVQPGKKELDVTGVNAATVQPTATGDVTFTLTVSNAADKATATVKQSVSPVAITQFQTNPATLTVGQPAALLWQVDGANDSTEISIDPDIGKVPATGQRPINPQETTQYTLHVKSADGTTQDQSTTITVKPPAPTVDVFTPNSLAIFVGDQVTLTWRVSGADSIEIKTGDGRTVVRSNSPAGSAPDRPQQPTTYILVATGPGGQTPKDTNVDVKPVPTPVPPPPVAVPPANPGQGTP